jgi:hypothetical protein
VAEEVYEARDLVFPGVATEINELLDLKEL